MTTEERLREAAAYLRTQHPRATSNGLFIDELMVRAADEMLTLMQAQYKEGHRVGYAQGESNANSRRNTRPGLGEMGG